MILIFFSSIGYSQKSLVCYYDKNWNLTNKNFASYYRIGVIDTVNYHFFGEVKDYHRSGVLQMKGYYNDNLKIDSFYFYHPSGELKTKGFYLNNMRYGVWTNFYKNGNIKDKIVFNNIFLAAIEYYDESGFPIMINGTGEWETEYYNDFSYEMTFVEGFYKDTLRDNTWNYYTIDSLSNTVKERRLNCTEKYKIGKFIGGTYFWGGGGIEKLNGAVFEILPELNKFKKTENWEYSDYASIEDYPILKFLPPVDSSFFPVEKLAEFPNGIDSLKIIFKNELKFSKNYIKSQKLRSVTLNIVICENGKLKIVQNPSKYSLSLYPTNQKFYNKVLKSIKKLPNWKPAIRDNKNVLNYFTLSVLMDKGEVDVQLISNNKVRKK